MAFSINYFSDDFHCLVLSPFTAVEYPNTWNVFWFLSLTLAHFRLHGMKCKHVCTHYQGRVWIEEKYAIWPYPIQSWNPKFNANEAFDSGRMISSTAYLNARLSPNKIHDTFGEAISVLIAHSVPAQVGIDIPLFKVRTSHDSLANQILIMLHR